MFCVLTQSEKESILKMFFRTKLKKNEPIIDNSIVTISKELGLNYGTVNSFLDNYFIKKEKLKFINNLEVKFETVEMLWNQL